jgi:cytidine deaminase
MKEISITSTFTIYDSVSELPNDVYTLMGQAIEIRKKRMLLTPIFGWV